jgi:hypothetical protein
MGSTRLSKWVLKNNAKCELLGAIFDKVASLS